MLSLARAIVVSRFEDGHFLAGRGVLLQRLFSDSRYQNMGSTAGEKKKRGRPPTGIGSSIGLRLYPKLESALDLWIASQPEPRPTRPEAIRSALQDWLGRAGFFEHESPDGEAD